MILQALEYENGNHHVHLISSIFTYIEFFILNLDKPIKDLWFPCWRVVELIIIEDLYVIWDDAIAAFVTGIIM